MRTNLPNTGGQSAISELRRTVAACMLWENNFYESGVAVADRIQELVKRCKPFEVNELAVQTRNEHKLRHAPLMLCKALAAIPGALDYHTLAEVCQRPDDMTEFLSLYWLNGKKPLTRQIKKGLARAFRKFDAYQLAKYNRDGAIKLRDVLFMTHAKPIDDVQAATWKLLVDNTLPAPDTWEVALSGGADKRETFERMLLSGKLGYMALLRNLRNMFECGIDRSIVEPSLVHGAGKSKVLPFRFVAAARAVPAWEPMIDHAMLSAMSTMERLSGRTIVLVDVSGSMDDKLSEKSDLTRLDAACALAVLVRGISDDCRVFSFSQQVVEVPARHGMALIDAINRSQYHSSTFLGQAVTALNSLQYDRLIVITDEQSSDRVPAPVGKGYVINVASYQNGVGYGQWTKINGWSESAVRYIQEVEAAK